MKRFAYWFFWAGTLLLLAGLSARLLWLAAQTETGLQNLRIQWRDATVGWFVGSYRPIPQREPVEQADFWLREVDRVLGAEPEDARLAMGAALVLDSPSTGFLSRYVKLKKIAAFSYPESDWGRIEAATKVFGVFSRICG